MILKTGFGYMVKDGKKIHKFELPIGNHPDPIGYTFVEVATKEELDQVVLNPSDEQIARDKEWLHKKEVRSRAKGKLTLLGLTDEEIEVLVGA